MLRVHDEVLHQKAENSPCQVYLITLISENHKLLQSTKGLSIYYVVIHVRIKSTSFCALVETPFSCESN